MSDKSKYIQTLQKIGVIEWAEGEHGWIGEDGQPITLAPWQRGALNAYWENRFDVTTFAISNIKKTGKTFLNALLTCYRWLAIPGQHFTLGNDMDQSQARQFSEISDMVLRSPFLSENVKVGKSELLFTLTGSKLTALAADAVGNAGANQKTSSHTEAWGILHESAIRSWEELLPPPGKTYGLPAMRIVDSYAGFLSESKTWSDIVDRGLAGKLLPGEWPIYKDGGLLLFHMDGEEAQERCFRGTESERIDYYYEQSKSLRPNAFVRMHHNQRTSGDSQFVTPEQWQACYDPNLQPLGLGEKVRLSVGIDASQKHDYTALVGLSGGKVRLVRQWKAKRGLFGKPEAIDLEKTVGAAILELHKAGQLGCVVFDSWQMAVLAKSFENKGIRVIEMPQTLQRTEADTQLFNAVVSGKIKHFNNSDLNEAVRNAIIAETPRGLRIKKEAASRKIDALIAMSMAWSADLGELAGGEFTIIANPFDNNLGEDEVYVYGLGVVPKNYGRVHAEGVTWRNCKKRTIGCQACVNEIEAEGIYAAQRERWVNNPTGYPDPDVARQQDYLRDQHLRNSAQRGQDFLKMFRRASGIDD